MPRKWISRVGVLWFLVAIAHGAAGQEPPFLATNVKSADTDDSSAQAFASLSSGRAVFVTAAGAFPSNRTEVWATDGSPEGTVRLRIMAPARANFQVVGNGDHALFFTRAENGLWSSDGTAAGTVEVFGDRVLSYERNASLGLVFIVTVEDGNLPSQQPRLYASDGTAEGTVLLADPISTVGGRRAMASTSTRTWLAIADTLWSSDGTPQGTHQVDQDIAPIPFVLAAGDHVIYKKRELGVFSLWRSDGTQPGTERIDQPDPDTNLDFYGPMLHHEGRITFVGGDLIRFEGTAAVYQLDPRTGPITELVRFDTRLESGALGFFTEEARAWTQGAVAGDLLYFTPASETFGTELWRSDGTVAGTHRVADLCPGDCGTFVRLGDSAALGDELLVPLDDGSGAGFRVWRTAGTADSTHVDTNLDRNVCGLEFPRVRAHGEQILVTFSDELWITDGTANGTGPVATGRHAVDGGEPFQGGLIYSGNDGAHGSEPWFTDGTPTGTRMIADTAFREGGSTPRLLTAGPRGDRLFFAGEADDVFGDEMWTLTPSSAAAPLVEPPACHRLAEALWTAVQGDRIFYAMRHNTELEDAEALWVANADGGDARRLATFQRFALQRGRARPFGDGIIFSDSGDGFEGQLLWRSDGTEAGTFQLSPESTQFVDWIVAGDRIYARGYDTYQLWMSDGTVEGTRLLVGTDGHSLDTPGRYIPFNGLLYFLRRVTDGTPEGTSTIPALADVTDSPGPQVANRDHLYYTHHTVPLFALARNGIVQTITSPESVHDLVTGDHSLYFGDGHHRVWRSRGSQATTLPLFTGSPPFSFSSLNAETIGDRLFFHGQGIDGLWTSDGTTTGTVQLAPGIQPEFSLGTATVGTVLFFTAEREGTGAELWRSNGTRDGTMMVADVEPGPDDSAPGEPTVAGHTLYFAATTAETGREPWALPLDGWAPLPMRLTAEDRFELTVRWQAPDGASTTGRPVRLTADTGYFWFGNEANVELMVKVLDGRENNGHFWVFFGSLSNLAYTLTVRDLETGAVQVYENPAGTFASRGDALAFPSAPSTLSVPNREFEAVQTATKGTGCALGEHALCLQGARFRVEVAWEDAQGAIRNATAVPLSSDTGYFWFGNEANVELTLKVLDGRQNNSHFWVFYGALSNLGYTITVTDTQTGAVKRYDNPRGTFASRGDIQAFPEIDP